MPSLSTAIPDRMIIPKAALRSFLGGLNPAHRALGGRIVWDPAGRLAGDGAAAIYLPRHVTLANGLLRFDGPVTNPASPAMPDHAVLPYDPGLGVHTIFLDLGEAPSGVVAAATYAGTAFPALPDDPVRYRTICSVGPGGVASDFPWEDASENDAEALDPLLPPALFGIEGRPYTVFPAQCFGRGAAGGFRLAMLSARTGAGTPPFQAVSTGGSIEVRPERTGPSILVRCAGGRAGAAQAGQEIRSRVAPAPRQVARVLMIGDSLTEQGGALATAQHLRAITGLTPRMIGTMALTNHFAPGNRVLGEGRGGRRFGGYVHAVTDEMAPLPPGEEAAYLAAPLERQIATNPFLRAATAEDAEEVVQNGQVFDLAFYLARFGLDRPTDIVFNLGTNDLTLHDRETALSLIARGLAITYAQCRATLPEARIAYVWNALGPADGDGRWEGGHRDAARLLTRFVRDRADERCVLIPAWMLVGRDAAFGFAPGPEDGETGLRRGVVDDPIHYQAAGQEALGEAIATAIAALAAGA